MNEELQAAVAAGILGTEDDYRALLQSVVDVAAAIFGAKAASIFLFDDRSDELVFEAVAGEGAETLVGRRFPSSTGVAGWVLVTQQPLIIEDVGSDPRFGREAAESTGFIPNGLMAAPLLYEERALGVLEVLDRLQDERFTLAEMELLSLFGSQAAIALHLLQAGRAAEAALSGTGDEAVVARLAALLRGEEDGDGLRLLTALEQVLRKTTEPGF
jgi:GAF domain-containing protein